MYYSYNYLSTNPCSSLGNRPSYLFEIPLTNLVPVAGITAILRIVSSCSYLREDPFFFIDLDVEIILELLFFTLCSTILWVLIKYFTYYHSCFRARTPISNPPPPNTSWILCTSPLFNSACLQSPDGFCWVFFTAVFPGRSGCSGTISQTCGWCSLANFSSPPPAYCLLEISTCTSIPSEPKLSISPGLSFISPPFTFYSHPSRTAAFSWTGLT